MIGIHLLPMFNTCLKNIYGIYLNMKIILPLIVLIISCSQPIQKIHYPIMNNLSIIPEPMSKEILKGTFDIKSITGIMLSLIHI